MAIATDIDTGFAAASTVDERSRVGRRISWGAVLGGVVMVLAVQLLLSLLGLGLGLSTVDATQAGGTPSVGNLSIGAGVWWSLSYLVALVIGGYVAARLAANLFELDGVLHGLLTWALALLVAAYLVTSAMGGIIGGAFSVVGSTLSATGQTVKDAVPQLAETAGITPDVVQQKVKALLSAQPAGADPKTLDADEAQREIAANLPTLITGDGEPQRAARERIVALVAAQANISPDEAQQRVDRLQAEGSKVKDEAVAKTRQLGDEAASGLSRAAIIAFVALLLGAGAAAFGGHLGAGRERYARR